MLMRNKGFAVVLLGAGLLTAGCNPVDPFGAANGATADYVWTEGKFDIDSSAKVAVVVVDRRNYILTGEKTPAFNGLVRQGYGVPFDSLTESGNTLSEDFTASIIAGLTAADIEAEAPELSSPISLERSRSDLMQAEADRYLLFVINEWKTDTYWSTVLQYSLELTVKGPDGAERLHKDFTGREEGKSELFTPKGRNAEVVSNLYPATLKKVIEDVEVAAALR